MSPFRIADIARLRHAGQRVGITSVCTAHPLAIEAALLQGMADGAPVLIEATCNQVNQDGGYTGMTPGDFRAFVLAIAERVGFDPAQLILGGDHLGPNPWRALPAEAAMAKAEAMIAAYARAGFAKLHLDTSMGCAGEAAALADDVTASRAARLAAAAEAAAARRGPAETRLCHRHRGAGAGRRHSCARPHRRHPSRSRARHRRGASGSLCGGGSRRGFRTRHRRSWCSPASSSAMPT